LKFRQSPHLSAINIATSKDASGFDKQVKSASKPFLHGTGSRPYLNCGTYKSDVVVVAQYIEVTAVDFSLEVGRDCVHSVCRPLKLKKEKRKTPWP
jgi:hypothetical protein